MELTKPMETLHNHDLATFLSTHQVPKTARDIPICFTGLGVVKGRWTIENDEYPKFLDLLHDYLFVKKYSTINLVEQRLSDGRCPILIDLDFKFPVDAGLQRRFNEETAIKSFIREYVKVLNEFIDTSAYESLRFFTCLRPTPYKTGGASPAIKDGVHIISPDIILPPDAQAAIRFILLEKNIIKEAFGDIGCTNSDKDIYDETMVRKNGPGWFFYGESKPSVPPYTLRSTYLYNSGTKKISACNQKYTDRQLMEMLSIRYKLKEETAEVREDAREYFEETRIRMNAKPDMVAQQPQATDAHTADTKTVNTLQALMPTQAYTDDEITLAKRLALECIAGERMDTYSDWMALGWALHSIDSSEEMFDVWMEVSRKSTKSGGNNVASLRRDWERNWGRADEGTRRLRFGSLHHWARTDNPQKYKEIIEDDIVTAIEFRTDATHHHIAKIMHKMFRDRFRASVQTRNTEWYEYNGNVWQRIDQGIEMKNCICTDVAGMLDKARARTRRRLIEANGTEGELSRKMEEERLKKLITIERSLYMNNFKESVMKECVGLFYEKDFLNKLNSNTSLLGCANGVIDLRYKDPATGEYRVNFRPGKPEDNISMLLGRNAPETDAIPHIPYNKRDPKQQELKDFFKKIFPKVALRKYMMRLLASCLEGMNREQCFYTWIGVGGNGKSKLVELMRLTLGEYQGSLAATALTRKRPEAGAANPDIISVKNARFIYLQEPDEREPLNTSRMKQFSGEDVVEARGLFQDQQKFKIQGKMFLLCNKRPPIHSMDRGTWRRIRVIPFESKFVDPQVEEVNPAHNVFPIDRDLDKKIYEWREAFLSYLVHIYDKKYLKDGLGAIPDVVKLESDKYREAFDSFAKFKGSRVRPCAGEKVALKDLCRAYKTWMEEFGNGQKFLSAAELEGRFVEEYGEPRDKKTFTNIRLFYTDEDVEEFDAANKE
jgi:P4 family phage/plasmid primase-like protien